MTTETADVLRRLEQKLMQGGAALPVPIDASGVENGLSIALLLVRDELRAALAAPAAAPAIPEGWKLVPVEPTEEMWTAGRDPVMFRDLGFHVPESIAAPTWRINPKSGKVETDRSKGTTAVHVWRAMIAAAPTS